MPASADQGPGPLAIFRFDASHTLFLGAGYRQLGGGLDRRVALDLERGTALEWAMVEGGEG